MSDGILGKGFDVIEFLKGAADIVGEKINAGLGMAKDLAEGALISMMPAREGEGLQIHAPEIAPIEPPMAQYASIEPHHIEAALAATHPIAKAYDEPQHAMQHMDDGQTMQLSTPSGIPNIPAAPQLQSSFSLA